jgi:4-amino-4-deoxy-L-arabinose transferase-like glycosyltransferase
VTGRDNTLQPERAALQLPNRQRVEEIATTRLVALMLFAFALGVRFLFASYWLKLPLGGDEWYYWGVAQMIAGGELIPQQIFLRPPIWIYTLAVAAPTENPLWGRVLTTLVGASVAPLTYLLARRMFSVRAGAIAAILVALYPTFIGYSHYLWAETFFLALSVAVMVVFFKGLSERSSAILLVSFGLLGVSLLAKETAVLLFVACLITVFRSEWRPGRRVLITSALLFLAPAVLYSLVASLKCGRLITLADAPYYNANQILHERQPWKMSPEESRQTFFRDLVDGKLKELPRNFPDQLKNLWTPTSFVAHRLLKAEDEVFGNYHAPYPQVWAGVAVSSYILIMVLGLTGLLLGPAGDPRTFSLSNLVLLCMSAAVFLMCSRFRLPMLNLLIIHGAALLAAPSMISASLRRWLPLTLWALSIVGFVLVLVQRWSAIGNWG